MGVILRPVDTKAGKAGWYFEQKIHERGRPLRIKSFGPFCSENEAEEAQRRVMLAEYKKSITNQKGGQNANT